MEETIKALLSRKKGILAADESLPSIQKRFDKIGLESTEENRRNYRKMLFTTQNISEFISGVILFDETIKQKTDDGVPFADFLSRQGVIPGIKVDMGTKPLALFEGEKITEGLDGLSERLISYFQMGAKFSKWRAVFTISQSTPSDYAIEANAHVLSRFAASSQEAQIVPIIEPEVLMDGAHSKEECERATVKVLTRLFEIIKMSKVKNEHLILKTNMVLSGKESGKSDTPEEVAELTLRALRASVPTNVPGIVFLSGGQEDEDSMRNLSAINKVGKSDPWRLTFSYGRALQNEALLNWSGKDENIEKAQASFIKWAEAAASASEGEYGK